MSKKRVIKAASLILMMCFSLACSGRIKAADASQVQISTDKAKAAVSVNIADSSLDGKDISVVCYTPDWDKSSDWNKNAGAIAYLGQVKGSSGTTSINFTLNKAVKAGDYTLVLGVSGNKISKAFNFESPVQNVGPVNYEAPSSVKAVQSAAQKVTVTWKAVAGASSYDVLRSEKENGTYVKTGSSTKTSYVDKKVKAGKKYYYKVLVTGGRNQSTSAKVTLMKAPAIKINSVKKVLVISWKKDTAADGYKVYAATKKNGKYKSVASVKGNKKIKTTVKKLKRGKKYYVKVAAYKKNGKKTVIGKASAVKKVTIK